MNETELYEHKFSEAAQAEYRRSALRRFRDRGSQPETGAGDHATTGVADSVINGSEGGTCGGETSVSDGGGK